MSKATRAADNQLHSIWNEFEIKKTYMVVGLRRSTPYSGGRKHNLRSEHVFLNKQQ